MTDYLAYRLPAAPGHHPAIETLAEYAAGQMRAGFDLVMAAHLSRCERCRNEVMQFEALGGGLLDTIEPAGLDDGALAATLARIEEPIAPPASTRSLARLLAEARRRWIAPGVWVAPIATPHDRDTRVFLLRAGVGSSTAHHRHSGAELTQVLVGALSDDGAIYRAGDLVEHDRSHAHHPQVAGNEPCICLFATQGRLRPSTWLGRIAFGLAGV